MRIASESRPSMSVPSIICPIPKKNVKASVRRAVVESERVHQALSD
jgi:hypothetical protein